HAIRRQHGPVDRTVARRMVADLRSQPPAFRICTHSAPHQWRDSFHRLRARANRAQTCAGQNAARDRAGGGCLIRRTRSPEYARPRAFPRGACYNRGMKRSFFLTLGGVGLLAWFVSRLRRGNYSFAKKTVLITGGSRGLGLTIARLLAREGARLALLA